MSPPTDSFCYNMCPSCFVFLQLEPLEKQNQSPLAIRREYLNIKVVTKIAFVELIPTATNLEENKLKE